MLRYLRENTGNWIIKFFLGIIVVVFVFLGVGSFGSKQNDSVATINDEPITIKEYQQAYKSFINQLQARFGTSLNDDLIKAFNVKEQALNMLVEQKLLMAEAEKMGISVSDKELRNLLLSIKAFQEGGLFDMERYKRVLSQNGTNPEIFEHSQIISMTTDKVKNLINANINVSDQEARAFYTYQNTKAAVDYVGFQPSDYTTIKVAFEAVQKYYEENKDAYQSPAKIKASYLTFSPKDYENSVTITDETIKNYYEQNIESFKTPEKAEASHILIRLAEDADEVTAGFAEQKAMDIYNKAVNGEDFAALARQFSEGPSKESGGYLGTFDRASMVEPFANAVFAMAPGDISEPVKTQFGLHVIKVMNRFDAAVQSLAQSSEQIKKQILKEESQSIEYEKAGLAFDSVIDGDDFEQAALIAGKTVLQTEPFDAQGTGLAIPNSAQFAREAFALTAEDISDVKQFGDQYYLIKITQRIAPAIQPIETVASEVEKDLISKLQKEQARKDAQSYLDTSVSAGKLADLTDNKTIKTTPLFTRNGAVEGFSDSSKITAAAFSLDEKNPVYKELVETADGFYIIHLKEKSTPGETEVKENFEPVKKEIAYRKQIQAYQTWLTQLKQGYTIKYDPAVLK
jgi:peptidyl-prolyl cis-trans isomerase D